MKTFLIASFAFVVWMLILRDNTYKTSSGSSSGSRKSKGKGGIDNAAINQLAKTAEKLERASQEQEISRVTSRYTGSGSSNAGTVSLNKPFG